MKKSFRITAFICASVFSIALLNSCSNSNNKTQDEKNEKEIAEEHNDAKFNDSSLEKDATYISDAYSSGLCEIEAAKRAKEYASAKETRDYATELIAAHVKLNEELKGLAESKQVSLQQGLTAEQLEEIKKSGEQKGTEYDKAYLSDVVSKHEKSISMFEKAADKSEDADVRKVFSNALPHLRSHLDKAMNVKSKLK